VTQLLWRSSISQWLFRKLFPQNARRAWFFRILIRLVVFLNRDFVINFYSRYNHGSENILKDYLAQVAFYEVIDPEIRKNSALAKTFSGITMVGEASMVWSKGLEDNEAYYLDLGMSCLGTVIEKCQSLAPAKISILEIGCAVGNCIGILDHRLGINVVRIEGMDVSDESIGYSRERFKAKERISFITANVIDWVRQAPANTAPDWDIVFSHLVFQFIEQDSLLEIFKTLREKRLVKTIIFSDSYCNAEANLNTELQSVYNPGDHGLYRLDHNHAYLMSQAGLVNIRTLSDLRTTTGFMSFSADCA